MDEVNLEIKYIVYEEGEKMNVEWHRFKVGIFILKQHKAIQFMEIHEEESQ